jgi:channel protein, hemolysin III family
MKKENKNVKKERVTLYKYSLSEELISAISHGVGVILAIVAIILCIHASKDNGAIALFSTITYGTSLMILYLMSTLYHSLKPNKAKKVFRIFDHCSIFLLIAGTYTPFCLLTLKGQAGWILFAIIWACAITGIVLNSINLEKFDKASFVLYLIMGWSIVFNFKVLVEAISSTGLFLLIAGGLAYTLGAVIYLIGHKVKYMHSIWHFFVLGGSIIHFFCIYTQVL